jgi:hypothetical protein
VNRAYLENVRREINSFLRWGFESNKQFYFSQIIQEMIDSPDLSKNQKHNVAIFVTEEGKWDLRFSGYCRSFFSLANSFHIKPILRYFNLNRKFFVLDFEDDRATLYVGGPERLTEIDAIIYADASKHRLEQGNVATDKEKRISSKKFGVCLERISNWGTEHLVSEEAPLIVTGIESLADPFRRMATYKGTLRKKNKLAFLDETTLFVKARELVREIADKEVQSALQMFARARLRGRACTDLLRIAKEAVRDNVAVLMVAKDNHIWGELDRMTGDLNVHYEQLTDVDDDLLDDLAEVVLSKKSKVLVLDEASMPTQEPLAAIFKQSTRPAVSGMQLEKNLRLCVDTETSVAI